MKTLTDDSLTRTSSRAERLITFMVIGVASLAAISHLALTALYNSPDNYVKITYDAPLSRYFGKLLYQNWSFFAPEPIDQDSNLYARGRDLDGRETAWIDVTGPLLTDMQRNRLSSYEFIATAIMNASISAHNDFIDRRKRHDSSDLMNAYHFRSLYRTSASVLMHTFPRRRFASVQIGLLESRYPRFTHRTDSNATPATYLYAMDWESFPADVTSGAW